MSNVHPLSKLLESEKSAILNGDFDDLNAIAPKKERLLANLSTHSLDAPQLRKISVAISRNQKLLSEAIKGVEVVVERIEVLRAARAGFVAYDKTGGRRMVGKSSAKFDLKF